MSEETKNKEAEKLVDDIMKSPDFEAFKRKVAYLIKSSQTSEISQLKAENERLKTEVAKKGLRGLLSQTELVSAYEYDKRQEAAEQATQDLITSLRAEVERLKEETKDKLSSAACTSEEFIEASNQGYKSDKETKEHEKGEIDTQLERIELCYETAAKSVFHAIPGESYCINIAIEVQKLKLAIRKREIELVEKAVGLVKKQMGYHWPSNVVFMLNTAEILKALLPDDKEV